MSILTSALSSFGLGQKDIENVTNQTLERLTKRDMTTTDQRKGMAIALSEMLNVLRAEDVITSETHKKLFKKVEKFQGKA